MTDPARYRVVDYYDLRPVDWLSGKRMPLEPGEGHTCDRCGAEHAVVYVVEDTITHKHYSVGSGCAKQSFGFDPALDKDARAIVRSKKKVEEVAVNDQRLAAASEKVNEIVSEVSKLSRPEIGIHEYVSKWAHFPGQLIRVFRMGDAEAEEWQPGKTEDWHDRQTRELAEYRWLSNRIMERVPAEWSQVSVFTNPNRTLQTSLLSEVCIGMARKKLP